MSTTGASLAAYADGIPIVQSTTDRNARFPSPNLNQRVYDLSSTSIERWNGSAWVIDFTGTGGANIISSNQLLINCFYNGTAWETIAAGPAWVIWQNTDGNLQIGSSGGSLSANQTFVPVTGLEVSSTGLLTGTTVASSDSSTTLATTAFVQSVVSGGGIYAPINSPVFTGTPTAPTPSYGDNSSRIATTAFVTAAVASGTYVSVKSYGAIGNGVVDDTATIQAAIAANPGAAIYFQGPAVFKITSPLTTAGPKTVFLGSPGAVISQLGTVSTSYDPDHLRINHSDCTVLNLTFQGQGRADGTAQQRKCDHRERGVRWWYGRDPREPAPGRRLQVSVLRGGRCRYHRLHRRCDPQQ